MVHTVITHTSIDVHASLHASIGPSRSRPRRVPASPPRGAGGAHRPSRHFSPRVPARARRHRARRHRDATETKSIVRASANASERETRTRRETRSSRVRPSRAETTRHETTTCRRNREAARGIREIEGTERRRSRRCRCRRSCGAWRRWAEETMGGGDDEGKARERDARER